jgi:hypothetical protein
MMAKISCTMQRRQAEGGLVQQQQARAQHQRARDRQHLLLAAGQRAGLLVRRSRRMREVAGTCARSPASTCALSRRV